MSGWESLGAALAGNSDMAGIKGQMLGLEAAQRRYGVDEAMLDARKKRDAELGRQALARAAADGGNNELANLFLQGTNPNEIGNYLKDKQRLDWGNQAWQGATSASPDMNAINRMLMVMSGKPADLTKVEGNAILNPMQTPDSQQITMTDLGKAMAGAQGALATEHYAQAGAANALRDQRRGAMAGGGQGAINPLAQALASDVHGDDYLKTLEPTDAAQVKALADGRMAFPTGTALKSEYWQNMLSHVAQYDPSFEAANYGARAATRKDFTAGKAAQTINALNTVSGHLGDLSDNAQALNNFGGVLTPLNSVKNFWGSVTGDPRIKQFEATKKAAVDELTRVYRGTGGSEADIKTWSSALNAADSPEQLQGTIGQINELLHSKVKALADQYQQGMGTIAGQKDFISPHAHAAFDRISQRSGRKVEDEGIGGANPLSAAMAGNSVGSIITGKDGRRYRITGGDPNDPDVEPIQ